MQIEKLNWDSEFFGYKVGKVIISNKKDFNFELFKILAEDYKLVYIYSSDELIESKIVLVDKKITFALKVAPVSDSFKDKNIVKFNKQIHSFTNLTNLAIVSGQYSRFNVDNNFKNNEFEKLYLKWIKNSLKDKVNIDVLVYAEDNKVLGFITLEKKSNDIGNIGLVAVSEKTRGKGIGSRLIETAIQIAFERNWTKIQVVTQKDNTPAVGLYQKLNFKESNLTYIYHYWNL